MKRRMRIAAASLLAAGLTGCSGLQNSSFETLNLAISGLDPTITVADVNALKGPALLVRFGQADALMVASTVQGNYVQWRGVGEHLVTDHGRLVRSAGLPTDILAPLLPDDPFILGLHNVTDGLEISRQLDYPARYQTGLRQIARYQRGALESVEIMGQARELQRIDERIEIPALGFKAQNRYWVDPQTGLILDSVQYLTPELPPLRLTLVRPYGGQP